MSERKKEGERKSNNFGSQNIIWWEIEWMWGSEREKEEKEGRREREERMRERRERGRKRERESRRTVMQIKTKTLSELQFRHILCIHRCQTNDELKQFIVMTTSYEQDVYGNPFE